MTDSYRYGGMDGMEAEFDGEYVFDDRNIEESQ